MGDVADVRSVLFLYCPEDVLEQRLLSRGKSSGRTDDNAETAKRRFRTYVETTLPVRASPSTLLMHARGSLEIRRVPTVYGELERVEPNLLERPDGVHEKAGMAISSG